MSKNHILDRGMPASVEAERAILGAILLDITGYAYNQAISGLRPDDFSLDSHRRIFGRMVEAFEGGSAIDFVTLTEILGRHKEIEAVGGVVYVTGLTDGLPRVKNIEQYVKIVRDKALLRQIIHLSNSSTESAYENELSAKQIFSSMQEQLLTLLGDSDKGKAARVSEFSEETWARLVERRTAESKLIGFSTGFDAIDYRTTGIRRKEFWTIGGRTGDGKTSLALQMAAANASAGIPVGYFSIEMDRDSLLERIWSSYARVDYSHVIDPKRMTEVEAYSLAATKDDVAEWPLFIEDSECYSISEIEARARLMIRQHGVSLIFVDYMQIVDAPGRDEKQQMTRVSKGLRRLAKGENIGVVGLSQMPRPKDHNMNKRPNKFDLKESGSLENDSNAVILIFRPVDEFDQYTGEDELIVGKKRSGKTGIEPAFYLGKYMRFEARETRF